MPAGGFATFWLSLQPLGVLEAPELRDRLQANELTLKQRRNGKPRADDEALLK